MHIKKLNITMENLTFDGTDPTHILDSVARFLDEADMLNMFEAQSFIYLQTLLVAQVDAQFRSILSGSSRHGGISC